MPLINDIIEMLSSQNCSLTDALLKTKVLLHRIGHKELVEWVNNELNGYSNLESVPRYRVLSAQVLVDAVNIAYSITAHPIGLGHLDSDIRDSFETVKMCQSLAVLEKFVKSDKSDRLTAPIRMEANALLGQHLGNGYQIQHAWSEIPMASVEQIFVQVRSRLLDFVLGLQDKFGEDMSDQEIKQKSGAFDASSLFNNAMFGDNATIIVGSHNKQGVTTTNVTRNLTALAEELSRHGVPKSDISDLEQAIETDKAAPEIAEKKFGASVRGWLRKMLSKAVDSSWQIELGVSSSLLVDALHKYYGWL